MDRHPGPESWQHESKTGELGRLQGQENERWAVCRTPSAAASAEPGTRDSCGQPEEEPAPLAGLALVERRI
ncbi:Autophagy-Related Protein 2 A [Manis pentadactyla]|nr:Autophagy-Related Protein 2 A [Manis pentadactyla]